MTSEASLSMSPQASEVLTILNHLLEIRRSNNRRPLLVTKVELEAALPYTYSKARPALKELYVAGLITYGNTINSIYFSTPEYEAIERGGYAP